LPLNYTLDGNFPYIHPYGHLSAAFELLDLLNSNLRRISALETPPSECRVALDCSINSMNFELVLSEIVSMSTFSSVTNAAMG
jgi:hypothetical protein